MVQPKSDGLSLSEAREFFKNLPVPYMGQISVSEESMAALRKVVDTIMYKNERLEKDLEYWKNSKTVASQSPEAAFTTLQQFEREQGNLVQVVATAQEEARIAKSQLQSAQWSIKGKDKTIEELTASRNAAVEDYDIQHAANIELVKNNRQYQQERNEAIEQAIQFREDNRLLREQQPRRYTSRGLSSTSGNPFIDDGYTS